MIRALCNLRFAPKLKIRGWNLLDNSPKNLLHIALEIHNKDAISPGNLAHIASHKTTTAQDILHLL